MHATALNRIAFVGNYVPRRCGIATYTHDLRSAVAAHVPDAECLVVPMNDRDNRYDYPSEVRFECRDGDFSAFRRAAEFLNLRNVDVVSLQHEFGIFGGPAGSHVLALLQEVHAPVHTTLHTVLARPAAEQKRVMDEVIRMSARLAVMSQRGRTLLRDVYGVPEDRVDVIPHGIPDMEFVDSGFHKDRFGLEGRQVLLTFGLLSPNKGIENVISALPQVVRRHPSVTYVVLGATHPHLLHDQGERYREGLAQMAVDLGVGDHVVFHDRYVEMPELLAFLGAADLYVTPYLNEDQITSGTLAYAFGCGKAVLSTPYWHAQELLAEGRGILVPFRDPQRLSEEIGDLLADDARRHAMRKRAYKLGREMVWSRVAERYADSFRRARRAQHVRPRRSGSERAERAARRELPPLCLDHLWRLSDATGVLQHATYDIPNAAEGYCSDDNARALTLMVQLEHLGLETPQTMRATPVYAAFLGHAFVPATGRFRNFMGFDRRWLDERGTDDCLGRVILALGTCVGRSRKPNLQRWALGFFDRALDALLETTSPRGWALGILGVQEYLRRLDGDRRAADVRRRLTEKLLALHRATACHDWPWLEDVVTYDNGRLCQALISSGRWSGDAEALQAGLQMLEWLSAQQHSAAGRFAPVGCHGFLRRGGAAAPFDQQPIEAQATACASIEAFHAVGDPVWLNRAWNAFEWFLGHNVLGLAVCDPRSGACRDGLLEDRTNENRGAESTLAYLGTLVEMKALQAHLCGGRLPRVVARARAEDEREATTAETCEP
jgi:glycosyltransferase involved in cell wall biosynthesis